MTVLRYRRLGRLNFSFDSSGVAPSRARDRYLRLDRGGLECFLLAHEHFKSRSSTGAWMSHELSPDAVGTFDLVFCPGVLYHARHPPWRWRDQDVTADGDPRDHSLIPAFHERTPLITFFSGVDEYQSVKTRINGMAALSDQGVAVGCADGRGLCAHEFHSQPSFRWVKSARPSSPPAAAAADRERFLRRNRGAPDVCAGGLVI